MTQRETGLLRLRFAMTVSGQELVISNQKSKIICHREAVFFFCHREAVRPWRSYISVIFTSMQDCFASLAMTLSALSLRGGRKPDAAISLH